MKRDNKANWHWRNSEEFEVWEFDSETQKVKEALWQSDPALTNLPDSFFPDLEEKIMSAIGSKEVAAPKKSRSPKNIPYLLKL